MLSKKGVLKNFAKFTGKLPVFFIKKETPTQRCFPVNFAKILRTTFFKEHLWWLLQVKFFFREVLNFRPNFTKKKGN